MSKEQLFENITKAEVIEKLHNERLNILDAFAKAYLAETKTLPSEIELVFREIKEDNKTEHIYFFRMKNK